MGYHLDERDAAIAYDMEVIMELGFVAGEWRRLRRRLVVRGAGMLMICGA